MGKEGFQSGSIVLQIFHGCSYAYILTAEDLRRGLIQSHTCADRNAGRLLRVSSALGIDPHGTDEHEPLHLRAAGRGHTAAGKQKHCSRSKHKQTPFHFCFSFP